MPSAARSIVRTLIVLLIIVVIAGGALCYVSYRAVVAKADASYTEYGGASARLSRFKAGAGHTFSIIWRLRFTKQSKQTPSVAVWHAQPFGSVEFQGAKR